MAATSASLSRGGLLLAAASVALWLQPSLRGDGGTARAQSAPPPGETAATPAPAGADFARDREKIFDAFYRTGLDVARPYTVTNLSIKKDNVTLILKQGVVFLSQPIAGEITGAAFLGEGLISMTPPNRTERYMLKKHYGAELLNEPFAEAVFRFTDGTHRTIIGSGKADPAAAGQAQKAAQTYQDRNKWLDGTRDFHLELQFLENRISRLSGVDFFLADLRTAKHDWLTYLHNPAEIHEHLITSSESMGGGGRRYLVPWTEWHKSGDYATSGHYVLLPDRDGPQALRMAHTDLTVELKDTKTVNWTSRTKVEPRIGNLGCLRFDLDNTASAASWKDEAFWPVRVTSVTNEAGSPLDFMHKKDQLLVILQAAAPSGVPVTIEVKGDAEVIYQVTAESYGLIQANWYPQYGYAGGRAPFRWTIRVPRPFTVTGSGKAIREYEDKERGQNVLETQSDIPVTFPWAIFGKFRKQEESYLSEETQKETRISVHTVTIDGSGVPAKKVQDILQESKDILRLYENIYGPYPYEELHIAQMGPDLGFGQGPPYFVQMTGEVFLPGASTLGTFSVHHLLSHEIAHQWWGNQIGWASDDDVWLSEAFAEYAASIFIHALQKNEGLQRILDEWRQNAKMGDKEAPIAAAASLTGPNAGDYRTSLLYNKGPYVLHMLRLQLDDEKYREVMRHIQQAYRHRDVSTEMLLREVNRVTKADYTSFFDQWVWDTGIPTFRYRWRSEKQPDGKYMITVYISQDDKSRVKKVLMPIHIHFKDKTIPQYKPVVQAEQEIKILSPVEPKKITLDDDHTLLADFVKLD